MPGISGEGGGEVGRKFGEWKRGGGLDWEGRYYLTIIDTERPEKKWQFNPQSFH